VSSAKEEASRQTSVVKAGNATVCAALRKQESSPVLTSSRQRALVNDLEKPPSRRRDACTGEIRRIKPPESGGPIYYGRWSIKLVVDLLTLIKTCNS
jgi:hypothetical protein